MFCEFSSSYVLVLATVDIYTEFISLIHIFLHLTSCVFPTVVSCFEFTTSLVSLSRLSLADSHRPPVPVP